MRVNEFIELLNEHKKGFKAIKSIRMDKINCGLYWYDHFLCAIPSNEIYLDTKKRYLYTEGVPHRCIRDVVKMLNGQHIIEKSGCDKIISYARKHG